MKLLLVHTLLLTLITNSFSVHANDDNAKPRASLRGGGSSRSLEEDDYNKLGHHHKEEVPDHMIGEFPPDIGRLPNLPFHQTKEDSVSYHDDDDNMMDTSFLQKDPHGNSCSRNSDCDSSGLIHCCGGFCCSSSHRFCVYPRFCGREPYSLSDAIVELEEDVDDKNKFDLNLLSSDHVAGTIPSEIGKMPNLPFHQTKEDPDDDELFDETSEYISAPWIIDCSADSDCNSGIDCCTGFCCPTHYPYCVTDLSGWTMCSPFPHGW